MKLTKLSLFLIRIGITGGIMLLVYGYTYLQSMIVNACKGDINGMLLAVISVGCFTWYGTGQAIKEAGNERQRKPAHKDSKIIWCSVRNIKNNAQREVQRVYQFCRYS